MANQRADVLWTSNERPRQERYVVRVTYENGDTVERSYKRSHVAAKEAQRLASEGYFVELLDNEPDYSW